jgi:Protein of unknown function (DUF3106)
MHLTQAPTFSRAKQLAAGVAMCCLSMNGAAIFAQTTTTASSVPAATPTVNGTEWKNLSPLQKTALAPLASSWQDMSAGQKRKWIVLSKNYDKRTPQEQAKLNTHMAQWASLSPQQRTQARLNFAENQALTKGLTPEQRQAQWQAYQLLSSDEKRQLAASSAKPVPSTAAAVKPTNPLQNTPKPQFGTAQVLGKPEQQAKGKIAVAPHLQKGNSLMPQTSSTVSISAPNPTPQ